MSTRRASGASALVNTRSSRSTLPAPCARPALAVTSGAGSRLAALMLAGITLAAATLRAEEVPVVITHATPRLTGLTATLDAPDGPAAVALELVFDDKGKLYSLDGASTVDGLLVSVTGSIKTKKNGEAKYVLKVTKPSPKISLKLSGSIAPGQGPEGGATVKYFGPSGKLTVKKGLQPVSLDFEAAPTSQLDLVFDETEGVVIPGPGGTLAGTGQLHSAYEDDLDPSLDSFSAKLKKTKLSLVAKRSKSKVSFKGTWDGSVYRGKLKWKVPPDKGVDPDAILPGFVIPTTGGAPGGSAFELLVMSGDEVPGLADTQFLGFSAPHIDGQGAATFFATMLDEEFNTLWGLLSDATGELQKIHSTDEPVPIPNNLAAIALTDRVVGYAPGGDAVIIGTYQVPGVTLDFARGLWHVDRDTGGVNLLLSGESGGVIDDSAINDAAGNVHPLTQRCQSLALNDQPAAIIGLPQSTFGKPFAGVYAWHGGIDTFTIHTVPVGGEDLALGPYGVALVVGCSSTARVDLTAPTDVEPFVMWGDPVPASIPAFGTPPCCAPGCLDPEISWSASCAPAGYLPDAYVAVVQTDPSVEARVAIRGERDGPGLFHAPGLWIGTDLAAPFCGALVTTWSDGGTSPELPIPSTAGVDQPGVDPLMFAPTNDLIAHVGWSDGGTSRSTVVRVGAINAASSGVVHLMTDKDDAPLTRVYGYSFTTGLVFAAGDGLWRTNTLNSSNLWIPIVQIGEAWKVAKGDVRTVVGFEASNVNASGDFLLRLQFDAGPFEDPSEIVYRVDGTALP